MSRNELELKITNPPRFFLQLGHPFCYIHVCTVYIVSTETIPKKNIPPPLLCGSAAPTPRVKPPTIPKSNLGDSARNLIPTSPTNNLSNPEHAQQKSEHGNFNFRCEKLPPNFPRLREYQENPLKSRRNPSPFTPKKTWKN
jgi:hypothetical protein